MSFDGPAEKGNLVVAWHAFITPVINIILSVAIFVTPLGLLYDQTIKGSLPWMAVVMTLVCLSGSALNFISYFIQISKFRTIAKFMQELHNFDKRVRNKFIS